LSYGRIFGADFYKLYNDVHTTLGTGVVVLMTLQPLLGLIHHLRFRKVQKRTIWTWIHMWYGRTLIILGIINGGLGLRLANITTPVGGKIAYGVVAGISGLAFLAWIVWHACDSGASLGLADPQGRVISPQIAAGQKEDTLQAGTSPAA
jgi:hypothetical protein